LFVLDALPFATAAPLLEWAPLVLVAANALDRVLEWGVKVDLAIVFPEEVETATQMLSSQAPVSITALAGGQTFLTQGLSLLRDKGQTAVNILTTASDAFNDAARFVPKLQVNILQEHLKWSAIPPGRFEKWFPADTRLYIHKSIPGQRVDLQKLEAENGVWINRQAGLVSIGSEVLFWVGEEL